MRTCAFRKKASSATTSPFSVLPKSENPLRSYPFRKMASVQRPFLFSVLPKSENPCAPVHSKNGLWCNYHPHSRFCLKVRIPCAPIHSEKRPRVQRPSSFSVLPKSENPYASVNSNKVASGSDSGITTIPFKSTICALSKSPQRRSAVCGGMSVSAANSFKDRPGLLCRHRTIALRRTCESACT